MVKRKVSEGIQSFSMCCTQRAAVVYAALEDALQTCLQWINQTLQKKQEVIFIFHCTQGATHFSNSFRSLESRHLRLFLAHSVSLTVYKHLVGRQHYMMVLGHLCYWEIQLAIQSSTEKNLFQSFFFFFRFPTQSFPSLFNLFVF